MTLQSHFLRVVAQSADRFGPFRTSFAPEDLVSRAQRRAGSSDFGNWSFREPMAVLLEAYEEAADLGAFDRVAVRWGYVAVPVQSSGLSGRATGGAEVENLGLLGELKELRGDGRGEVVFLDLGQ